jgi:cation:H+ antiporter
MVAAALVLVPTFAAGEIGRLPGALLVLVLAGYLTWAYLKPGLAIDEDDAPATTSMLASGLWIVAGLVTLMLGA